MTASEVLHMLAAELSVLPDGPVTRDKLVEAVQWAADRVADDEWMERMGDSL